MVNSHEELPSTSLKPSISGGFRGWQGWLVTQPVNGLKNCALCSSRSFFVLSSLKLKSDAKYKSIPSRLQCLEKYILCIHCNVCSPVKVATSYCEPFSVLCTLWRQMHCILCEPLQWSSWKGLSLVKTIWIYYTALDSNCIHPICKHVPPFILVPSRQMMGIVEK